MTNKEWKIKNLRHSWGDLLLEKERKIREIWDIEYKLNLYRDWETTGIANILSEQTMDRRRARTTMAAKAQQTNAIR